MKFQDINCLDHILPDIRFSIYKKIIKKIELIKKKVIIITDYGHHL